MKYVSDVTLSTLGGALTLTHGAVLCEVRAYLAREFPDLAERVWVREESYHATQAALELAGYESVQRNARKMASADVQSAVVDRAKLLTLQAIQAHSA